MFAPSAPFTRRARLLLPLLLAAALPAAFHAERAFAHGVYIFAWTDGPRLCAESYFSKKSKVRGGEVRMQDAHGALLASGISDDAGLVCFDPPAAAQDITFVVAAGQGHRGEFLLPAADVAEALAAARRPPAASEAKAPAPAASSSVASSSVAPASAPVAAPAAQDESAPPGPPGAKALAPPALEALIRSAVQEELRRELAPLRKALAAREQGGPSAKDIVGGLGWIAGLAGFGALYASRRKKD